MVSRSVVACALGCWLTTVSARRWMYVAMSTACSPGDKRESAKLMGEEMFARVLDR